MKISKSFLALVAIIVLTSSCCNKLEDLLDVTFNVEYSVDLDAIVPPLANLKTTNGNFSASASIDPNTNEKFAEYADKIKGVEITSISAKVLEISKQVTIEHASIAVFSGTKNTSWAFSNEILTVGKILTMGNESGQWTIVQDILEDKNIFTVDVVGETDVDDVEFTIEITIRSKVIANPLN